MRDQALKVVDAVRAMQLVHRHGKTISELDITSLALALDGVRKAIEEFDANTGYTAGEFNMKHRPEFAVPLQMADDGYVEEIREQSPTLEMKLEIQAEIEHEVEQELEEKHVEDIKKSKDIDSPEPELVLPKPVLAAAVLSQMTARPGMKSNGRRKKLVQVGNGVFYDGNQYVNELRLSVNAINDKLTYAVKKIGWNPRLRRMAEALRKAQENFAVEMKGGRGYVLIPADKWGALSVAIAESALNQDLTVALPQPKPRMARELELEKERKNAPRPPAHMFK
ncbi:hypothetical protein [Mesorhizobium sp. SP-1A]|uniref:hypothetical protein n=1 Tax=Mesorhizobium sp. SP-1A TaxID=3077840 RepID=UPI0028F6FA4C|nr:hypothetical protein [Mesorhizobium sp. SP-1A]